MTLPSGHATLAKIRGLDNLPWLVSVAIGCARDDQVLAGVPGVARLGVKPGVNVRAVDFYSLMGMSVLLSVFGPKSARTEILAQDALDALARARPSVVWAVDTDGEHARLVVRFSASGPQPWATMQPALPLDESFREAARFWHTLTRNVAVINSGAGVESALIVGA